MRTVLFFVFVFFAVPIFCQNADSLAVVREVDSLIQQSRRLTDSKAFEQALLLGDSASTIASRAFGQNHLTYGRCQFNLGRVHFNQRKYDKSDMHYAAARDILERAIGKENPEYAQTIYNIGLSYKSRRKYAEAEEIFLESKSIQERIIGKESTDYTHCTYQLALLHTEQQHFDVAEQYFRETLVIREKLLGKAHEDYLSVLSELGIMLRDASSLKAAESVFQDVLAIYKQKGIETEDYALNMTCLAIVLRNSGRYRESERHFLDAKEMLERLLGKDNTTFSYAFTINSLANLYSMTSQYELAVPLNRLATEIYGKQFGKVHSYYAAGLISMAGLYEKMRLYDQAEVIYREALNIVDSQHPYHAGLLANYGTLFRNIGKFEEAERYLEEALRMLSKQLPEDHMDIAMIKTKLGQLYACPCMAQYSRADSLLVQAKNIYEKKGIRQCLDCYLSILQNQGDIQQRQGAFKAALQYYLKTLEIYDNTGIRGLGYLISLRSASKLYKIIGQPARYFELLQRSAALENELLLRATTFMNQTELKQFQEKIALTKYDLGRELVERPEENAKLTGTLFDQTLSEKGFLLQEAQRLQRLAANADDSTQHVYLQWKICQRNLNNQYSQPADQRGNTGELESEANALEKTLVQRLSGFAQARQSVTWPKLQQQLPLGAAALEFVHFEYGLDTISDSTMYAALLLRPGDAQPRFIPLFEEKSLNSLLDRNADRNELYVKRLYSLADRGAKPLGKPQKSLYDLLWKPLEKELADVKTIYFSPSGLLHRLNLAAIPINMDSVLGDRYNLVELGSTRQLVIPATVTLAANDAPDASGQAVLLGGIQYDSDSTAMSQANATLDSISIASRGELSFSYTDSTLRTGTWSALPFTDREVTSVEKTLQFAGFKTSTRRGYAATEEAFKTIGAGGKPSPRVLHLATHGFFFPDPKNSPSPLERGLGGDVEPVFKMSDHPMIRSGLILAGANHAWATGKPFREGMEDGILTAYEISQMNLSNTELVVLSACETGLGDIQGNEGVYGLQRAFKIAGAKYLIMSLWQVDDEATMEFMKVFYRKWLESKMPIPDAFRATQAEMHERFLKPYLWAGFVLVE